MYHTPQWPVDPARISVVIPTLNAGPHLPALLPALARQGLPAEQFLIVDSESSDESCNAFRAFGATVVGIDRRTFNHGGTRQRAVEMRPDSNIVVMLTQDAIPQGNEAILRLVDAFADPQVGMAYGRQLPRRVARGIERHARLTNYPPRSETRSLADRERIGVKTVFCSDSFAAYRTSALAAVGGFPEDAFFAEDQLVAGRMLIDDWRIAYCGDAEVQHSHGYTMVEEFRRYFDVGVFHGRNRWLIDTFGAAEGEGLRFIRSELAYLMRHDPLLLPSAMVRTLAKYAGYKMGSREAKLSNAWKQRLSMQPFYWRRQS
ncbi:glycosyltransferase [Sphingomonas sp. CFBP 13720]|uniref:glycosyltransferase n=1 Tax=Sphingomonas sp. CFBP 13720 TaxID=2775302 RepID=UPI001785F23B|nr:glycosyltransferase [Sphingomonas sp. CFBP 13720]MBD8679951.1 glycosyltransferase family 2 protein [Sphingomonas sp. CFBP 13720]